MVAWMDEIGIGFIGHGFMGRAHAHALLSAARLAAPLPLRPRLVAVAGRDEQATQQFGRDFGFERATTDWQEVVAAPDVGVVHVLTPNHLHAEPCLAAAAAGKHLVCEKPLARDAGEAARIRDAARAAGVVALCAFNYRFMPAVRLAREIAESGALGELRHARFAYLQSWGEETTAEELWRFDAAEAGAGAIGDLASHAVDLARTLAGELAEVAALDSVFVPGRVVDDAIAAAVRFAGGATGTLEATRFATGRRNHLAFELNGSGGSLRWDVERLNELWHDNRRILVTETDHPFMAPWWPPGHVLGWGDSFVNELVHFLDAVAGEHGVAPVGADFDDGVAAAEACDALARSAASGRREAVGAHGETGAPASADA
jgi:predicted dehydrogenase